ncbi:MAG: radical SAM family heme chaperone HemW, partial [Proteobacteria bacterium]|nr:radical SAM family heme chaperone HemW [Pseudomonadota bacterium]
MLKRKSPRLSPNIQQPASPLIQDFCCDPICNPQAAEPAGIYLHIPFCLQKCSYCDFYSISDASLHRPFVEALTTEMRLNAPVDFRFDTLYLGGGTPSLFSVADIGRIIDTAFSSFNMLANAEITLEVNPGTLTLEKLDGYRSAGINRISIGVQSFTPANLYFLGRSHSAGDAALALKWARDAGFENLGIDLIYGIPGQNQASWVDDLQQALVFEPEHLSCYMLTYETGTLMDLNRRKQRFRPLPERRVRDMFEITLSFLDSRGYAPYEISNFARTGKETAGLQRINRHWSRHNLKYWSFVPYLGFGPSAHSFEEPERRWNLPDVNRYITTLATDRFPSAQKETLSR